MVGRSEIGQMMASGITGPKLTSEERALITSHRIGWIVLFSRNILDPLQTADLCRELHDLDEDRILIAVDQEGGRVSRLPPPFTQFPAPSALGHCGPEGVYQGAVVMAREMQVVGIDIDFAPVLDVASNPGNPVIRDRAFSSDPEAVACLGSAMVRGLMAGGVIPCGKHFPGHGDTDDDSHLVLPTVRAREAILREREFLPFQAAIRQGIPCLMAAHVVYPALDLEPATVSQTILRGILRGEMGFTGLVFSDDMEMKAIASPTEAALQAVQAGVDVLLVCHDPVLAIRMIEALEHAVQGDSFLRERVTESLGRIRAMKAMASRSMRDRPPPAVIGCEEHQRIARQSTRDPGDQSA